MAQFVYEIGQYISIFYLRMAHGRVVTCSPVTSWMCDCQRYSHAACHVRGVGQTSHTMLPLSTQQGWIPGGTKKLNCNATN